MQLRGTTLRLPASFGNLIWREAEGLTHHLVSIWT